MPSTGPKAKADLVIADAAEIVTCARDADDGVGRIPGGWIAIAADRILAVGSRDQVLSTVDLDRADVLDASGRVVVPGFVDSHTHLVFGGSRVEEYCARLTLDDPVELDQLDIPKGIHASVDMTRAAHEDDLFTSARARLLGMLRAGTTTVEIKSGYGLSTSEEIKMLRVNARLDAATPVDVVSTFLGAHGVPRDVPKDVYLNILIEEMIPWVSSLGLAAFCDVWCDDGYFTASESERILRAALDAGLKPKIHADAYSYIGASDLAADMRMVLADHLNYTPPEAMRKMARAGVTAVLMPALDFAVQHTRPFNARAIIDAGMNVALATDLCPACWTESMQFVMALACRLYRMSPAEALRAATLGGAQALGLEHDRGSIEVGKLADLQIWNVPSYEYVVYQLGGNVVERVIKGGRLVVERSAAIRP